MSRILAHCPHLSSFNLSFILLNRLPESPPLSSVTCAHTFKSRLIPALRGLTSLRKLHLSYANDLLGNGNLALILKCMPLLESFCVSFLLDNTPACSLGKPLSTLKHLLELRLWEVLPVDLTWCRDPWPKPITHLRLHECSNVTPTSVRSLVHHIAPNVTDLRINFELEMSYSSDVPNWHRNHQFDLPSLETLKLISYDHNLLPCFKGCKELSCVSISIAMKHWESIQRLICASTWPKLRHLRLRLHTPKVAELNTPEHLMSLHYEDQISKFCDLTGIVVDVIGRYAKITAPIVKEGANQAEVPERV